MKGFFFLTTLLCTLSLWGCAKDNKSEPTGVKPGTGTGTGDYELVWSDEFNYAGLPDSKKWSFDTDGNASGWGNNEAQFYTSSRLKNAEVKDGVLRINAIKEDFEGKKYTSARLVTRTKGDWLYGKVEVRAKLPDGRGMWPAIWMLPTDWTYGGWPASGEIDIMENVGYDPFVIVGTAHTQAYNHVQGTQKSGTINIPDCYTEFHNYILEWEANEYRIYVDSKLFFTFRNEKTGFQAWPFDKRFHLLLNVAVGGNWGGAKGIDDSIFPRTMLVDYVRVYQRK
ncbi:MAG: glycoside hydrolase family 16 protein [Prolixibacteraceae bacterium]|nr:glycoside hydrolase family 16 protein [Prolixibacteraceae bacterium]